MTRVVIVGAGFAGLHCAKRLAGTPLEVLLLDRHNYHLFTPLLYQVASSLLNPSDIAYPVRSVFRRVRNVTFRVAEVISVDEIERVARTAEGPCEPFDKLVMATGARVNFFGQEEVARRAFWLNDLPGALALRNHVLSRFEAAVVADSPGRERLLTFVIVGGGPTGVEYAGALAELVKLMTGTDFPSIPRSEVSIVLVEGQQQVLAAFPSSLGEDARRRLERLGVTVKLGALVESYAEGRIRLSTGETIETDTLVWAAGVRPNNLTEGFDARRRKSGRFEVDECFRVIGREGVFAIGDVAAFIQDGKELPLLAQPAIQAGRALADNLLRDSRGEPMLPFRYRDPGIMATIGRNAGVARIGKLELKGWSGWATWLVVHLYFIIGFRNRVSVLLRWGWNYLFYDRPIRFMYRDARPPRSGTD